MRRLLRRQLLLLLELLLSLLVLLAEHHYEPGHLVVGRMHLLQLVDVGANSGVLVLVLVCQGRAHDFNRLALGGSLVLSQSAVGFQVLLHHV